MRLSEVAPDFVIRATRRFRKELASYIRAYPQIRKNFHDFCSDKMLGRRYGAKDSMYSSSGPLGEYMHAHLVHGRVIVIYSQKVGCLNLYHIGEHAETEGKGAVAMASYIKSLSSSDLEPIKVFDDEATLSSSQKSEIVDLIDYIVASDPDVARKAMTNLADMMYFMRASVDTDEQTILNAFGGAEAIQQMIASKLKQVFG